MGGAGNFSDKEIAQPQLNRAALPLCTRAERRIAMEGQKIMMKRRLFSQLPLTLAALQTLTLIPMAQGKEASESQPPMSMDDCIATCLSCHRTCIETASTVIGDKIPTPVVAVLLDCAELCLATAHSMSRRSPLHKDLCGLCARVCESCATTCQDEGGDKLVQCARACRECASSCRNMASMH